MDILGIFKSKPPASKEVAKSRLKFVLIQDRFNCSPETLEAMKTDILKAISNYVEIDETGLDIQFTKLPEDSGEDSGNPAIFVNIPILNTRRAK